MKNLLCNLVLIMAAAGLAATSASAAVSGDYRYTDNGDGTCTITGYTGYGGDITIPDYLADLTVVAIGNYAFVRYDSLTGVTIPDSVTTVGIQAFAGCNSLTSVTIPDSVTTIEDGAFYYCASLTGVTIPDSITTIADNAFARCNSLTSITVDPANNAYCDIDGVLFNKSQTTLIQYPGGKSGDYSIPNSVITIGDGAFCDCDSLTGVIIPDSVTTIGDGAFCDCNSLTGVIIPDSVTTIGSWAFDYCDSLTDVTIPNSVTTIGNYAFRYCGSLTGVTIPDGVTTIGNGAFRGCDSLTGTTIPDSVITIGNYAFSSCDNLTSVTIGNGVTTIGDEAFYSCTSLTGVTIGNSVTTIGDEAFDECNSLAGVYFRGDCPASVGIDVFYLYSYATAYYIAGTSGWDNEFAGQPTATWTAEIDDYYYRSNGDETCILIGYTGPGGNITIPDSLAGLTVTIIEDYAFCHCNNLTGVTIPDSVITIGNEVFEYCDSMTSVTIGNSVTTIGDRVFYNCVSLTAVTIGNSVITIGNSAFEYCDSMTSVTIGNSVTTIGNRTFSDCDNLTGVTIPDSVTTIGNRAFYNCDSLASVTIPNSVTTIEDSAFYNCDSLTGVIIPDSVTAIGDAAFSNCESLTGITVDPDNSGYCDIDGVLFNKRQNTLIQYPGSKSGDYSIPDSVITIGDWAFSYCVSLTGVTIPDSVTTTGDEVFRNCDSLASVTIGNSVTTIGDYVFYSCDNLTGVYFRGDCPASVGSNVFSYSDDPTVYYMAGTSGWGSYFAGRPTAVWPASMGMTGNLAVDMEIDEVGGLDVLEIDVFAVSKAVDWTISGQDGCSWITDVSPDTGSSTGPADITAVQITIDTAGLAVADHTHSLTLSVDDGYWLPLSIELHVYNPMDMEELAILAAYWGDSGCADEMSLCYEADFYRDGVIDALDLMQLALSWLGEEMIYGSNWTDYLEDFSGGSLPVDSWSYSSTAYGRIEVIGERMRMDCSAYSLNEAILHLDLEGQSEVMLSFWQRESGDEIHSLPTTFSGSYNGDGVAVSPDGVNWTTVVNASALDVGTTGQTFVVDLDALGLEYTSDFQIKFQQYDNYTWSSDGREWDNIQIYKE